MGRFLARRLVFALVTLWAVATLVFVSTLLLPGDAARAILGNTATPDQLAAMRDEMGLNVPPLERYFSWLGGLSTGDLGSSVSSGREVSELLGSALSNSGLLVLLTALIAFPISVTVGVWSAWRRDSAADHVATIATLILAALPEFVIAFLLLYLFSTGVLSWFPATATSIAGGGAVFTHFDELVLPVATLVIVLLAYGIRMTRATMLEVLEADYIQQARLNGLSERSVLFQHALKNAIGPVAQVMALQLAWLMGGVVIVEYVFNYPGIGKGVVDAVAHRDVTVVQGFTLVIAAAYVLVNIAADGFIMLSTPKARARKATS